MRFVNRSEDEERSSLPSPDDAKIDADVDGGGRRWQKRHVVLVGAVVVVSLIVGLSVGLTKSSKDEESSPARSAPLPDNNPGVLDPYFPDAPGSIILKSNDFQNDTAIPTVNTPYGKDRSPHLSWSDVPSGTQSVVIICEGIDADVDLEDDGPFAHWVVFDIPHPDVSELEENQDSGPTADKLELIDPRIRQGLTSWDDGEFGWSGPDPPVNVEHRYAFRIYALDGFLGYVDDANRNSLIMSIRLYRKVLAFGMLVGTYERSGM